MENHPHVLDEFQIQFNICIFCGIYASYSSLHFRSLALLTDDHVTLFLVFSDKMAENGEVNTDHEDQKNG